MIRRFIYPMFVGSILTATIVSAAGEGTVPSVRIAKFAGDRAAAISYTFDDGLRDQLTLAVPMLDEFGFKGTFFVIPGRVSDTVEDAERRKNDKRAWGTITWAELKEMSAQGHEIGSHTWSHPNLTKLPIEEVETQMTKASAAIDKHIGKPPLTLAFPFNARTLEIETLALKHCVAFRAFQLGTSGKSSVDSLNKWADKQVSEKNWGVIMTHAIESGYAAFSDPEILRTHLKYVKSRGNDIWVDTFANVARYGKERDVAKLVVTGQPGNITLMLSSTLDSQTYNVPLTIVIDAPDATSVHAKRSGIELPARVDKGSIHVEASPATEPITIKWK